MLITSYVIENIYFERSEIKPKYNKKQYILVEFMDMEFMRVIWSNSGIEFYERFSYWLIANQKILFRKNHKQLIFHSDTMVRQLLRYLGIDTIDDWFITYSPSPIGGGDLQWVQKYLVEKISSNRIHINLIKYRSKAKSFTPFYIFIYFFSYYFVHKLFYFQSH